MRCFLALVGGGVLGLITAAAVGVGAAEDFHLTGREWMVLGAVAGALVNSYHCLPEEK